LTGKEALFFTIKSEGCAVPFTSWPLWVKPITVQFLIMSNHIITRLEETLRGRMIHPTMPVWAALKSSWKAILYLSFWHFQSKESTDSSRSSNLLDPTAFLAFFSSLSHSPLMFPEIVSPMNYLLQSSSMSGEFN
jgi:hypothetical protein